MRFFRLRRALVLLLLISTSSTAVTAAAEDKKFQLDEWVTECDTATGAPDCSITVPFWQGERQRDGAFALVVMLQTGSIGIVGEPPPNRAVLRVDKNPAIECRQARYCVFPSAQAPAVFRQLKDASLILVDVFTAKGTFSFNLTPKGYQAGIAKIRSWGYRLPSD